MFKFTTEINNNKVRSPYWNLVKNHFISSSFFGFLAFIFLFLAVGSLLILLFDHNKISVIGFLFFLIVLSFSLSLVFFAINFCYVYAITKIASRLRSRKMIWYSILNVLFWFLGIFISYQMLVHQETIEMSILNIVEISKKHVFDKKLKHKKLEIDGNIFEPNDLNFIDFQKKYNDLDDYQENLRIETEAILSKEPALIPFKTFSEKVTKTRRIVYSKLANTNIISKKTTTI